MEFLAVPRSIPGACLHGAARLQLQTAVTNRVGQSLYESCGWKRDDLFYVYEKSLAG